MKRLLPLIATLMLAGCLATENRKVETTSRGVAPTTSNTLWWREPYMADRPADNEWDKHVPIQKPDPLDEELKYFEENVIKWPETMPPAYNPPPIWVTPAPKSKDSAIHKKLNEKLLPPVEGEVY